MANLPFTRDPAKARANERKHGVFTEAQTSLVTSTPQRAVTIRLDEPTITYFKAVADETGIAYQTLINSYLRDCAESKRRPTVR